MLSDLKARSAKPSPKGYKLTDQGGLCLFISTHGTKSWRYNYRLNGKRETLTIGKYPEISLTEARLIHAEARSAVARGERARLLPNAALNAPRNSKPQTPLVR